MVARAGPFAESLTLVDSSPEVLAINASRIAHPDVTRIQADLFAWEPTEHFDSVFFSFWLSHVPLDRFAIFWQRVEGWLKPGGRVFFIDSLYDERSTARDHQLHGPAATTINRKLNDGREFRIVKVFYGTGRLAAAAGSRGLAPPRCAARRPILCTARAEC